MHRVGIVCDSTCDLGPEWLSRHDVRMVPLKVLFGTESYLDWVDLPPERFYEILASSAVLPKTSQPSPAEFASVYESMASEGCEEIVSVHLSAALSGTFASATLAAADAPVRVHVVDSKSVSQATALVLKAALEARASGGTAADVAGAAERAAATSRMFFVLNTLEYLVKGGRAGKAAGLAASVLNVKPILTFNAEGTIEPFKKVKGMKKALSALATHVAEDAMGRTVRLSILHGAAPELAEQMRAALDTAGVAYVLDTVESVGAVIGTYAGPGAVGVAYVPHS